MSQLKGWRMTPGWSRLLVAVLLVVGIGFRLVHLDRKVYWHDEAFTSLRISGYTAVEVVEQVFTGDVIGVEDLQQFQRVTPSRGLKDTVRSLILEDSQHPPLYYGLVRLWAGWFNSEVATLRSLSVLFGLLVFPAAYWLCRELFEGPLVAWIALALLAVSPFHVLYAQEAREYAMWTVLILASSAALLRSLRLGTGRSWGLYALTLILGFYTHPFTGFVAVGHGAYVLGVRRQWRWRSRPLLKFLLAFSLAVLTFLPWLIILVTSWSRTGANWAAVSIPLSTLLKIWGLHLERLFFLTVGDFGFDVWWVYLTLPLLVLLVSYSLYALCRQTPARTWWFVLTLIGATALPLALPDLLLGGQRSTAGRYLVPCFLGAELAVAYLLATKISVLSKFQRRIWQSITALVVLGGVFSCSLIAPAETAWTKVISYYSPSVARIVNSSAQPLLISSDFGINFGSILALSHALSPQVKLQLWAGVSTLPEIPSGFSEVFWLNPPALVLTELEQQNGVLELRHEDFHLRLWQLQ